MASHPELESESGLIATEMKVNKAESGWMDGGMRVERTRGKAQDRIQMMRSERSEIGQNGRIR